MIKGNENNFFSWVRAHSMLCKRATDRERKAFGENQHGSTDTSGVRLHQKWLQCLHQFSLESIRGQSGKASVTTRCHEGTMGTQEVALV